MSDYYGQLLMRHRGRGIIIDTNILVMFFVGALEPKIIPTFKRTKTFTIEDYDVLQTVLQLVPTILTTPNIITETSNLLGQLPDHQRTPCFELFAKGVTILRESYLPSGELATTGEFKRFGVTDAGLIQLAAQHLILTDDFPLAQFVGKQGIEIINFNHIRSINW